MNDCSQWWIAIIGWIGCVVVFAVAMIRWSKSQKVQRAEFLERLIEKFKNIKYDEYLQKMEMSSEDDGDYGDESDNGVNAYDFFIFLSYVCYLRITKIIDDNEFLSFRYYVERAIRLRAVREYLAKFHVENHMDIMASPYYALLKYCQMECFDGMNTLYAEIELTVKKEKRTTNEQYSKTISINDNVTYRTHLDVLNGIFNKGMLFHMRGGAPLDANTLVWFPHIREDGDFVAGRMWNNTLSADGMELRECCNDAARFGGNVDAPKVKRRYVFATFDGERERCYRFKGIFEFVKNETANPNEIRWLYRRVADSFGAKKFS